MNRPDDIQWMQRAVDLSRHCPPAETFNVGCLVLDVHGKLMATGYSREREGGMHAEEIALAKIDEGQLSIEGGTLYSTLEPCHPRLSGKTSCTQHIINHKLRRVVFAVKEPAFFVVCKGADTLVAHGIEVTHLTDIEKLVKEINAHIFRRLPKV